MNILASDASALDFSTPCLLVPIWSDAPLAGVAADLDKNLDGLISDIIENDGFKAKIGDTRTLYTNGQPAARVVLFGLGKEGKFTDAYLRKAVSKAARAARGLKKTEIAIALGDLNAQATTEALVLGLARFSEFKEEKDATEIETVTLLTGDAATASAEHRTRANYRRRHAEMSPPGKFAVQQKIARIVWRRSRAKSAKLARSKSRSGTSRKFGTKRCWRCGASAWAATIRRVSS